MFAEKVLEAENKNINLKWEMFPEKVLGAEKNGAGYLST